MKVAPTYLLPPARGPRQRMIHSGRNILLSGLAICAGLLGGAWILHRPAQADSPHHERTRAHEQATDTLHLAAREVADPMTPPGTLLERRHVLLAGLHVAPADGALWLGASRLTRLLLEDHEVPDRRACLASIHKLVDTHADGAQKHAPLLAGALSRALEAQATAASPPGTGAGWPTHSQASPAQPADGSDASGPPRGQGREGSR